jgi:hypothetical protein
MMVMNLKCIQKWRCHLCQVSLLWLEKILAEIIRKQLAEQIVLPAVAADTWFLLKASEGGLGRSGEAAKLLGMGFFFG